MEARAFQWFEGRALTRSVAATLALACAGCGYTSRYTPPPDGRARPVWSGNKVEAALSGMPLTDDCLAEAGALTGTNMEQIAGRPPMRPARPGVGFWIPVYFGPHIFVTGHLVPPLRPPLFAPALAPPGLPHPVTVPAPRGPSLKGGGGGGSGSDMGKALVVLAVVALLVLPAVDIGVALADPEDGKASSRAIDQVNALNDLARWPGSPCAYAPFAAPMQAEPMPIEPMPTEPMPIEPVPVEPMPSAPSSTEPPR